jgi:hypothetical protein
MTLITVTKETDKAMDAKTVKLSKGGNVRWLMRARTAQDPNYTDARERKNSLAARTESGLDGNWKILTIATKETDKAMDAKTVRLPKAGSASLFAKTVRERKFTNAKENQLAKMDSELDTSYMILTTVTKGKEPLVVARTVKW